MERDVSKRWMKQNIRIACIGFENQTDIDNDMPLRVIGYDGTAYRAELLDESKERYPVVTLVLYFGVKHWDKPLRLFDCFDVPAEFQPYVNDYKINVFEIANLPEEKVKLFTSDFAVVAEHFTKVKNDPGYEPDPIQLKHVYETMQLMSALTGDKRYEEAYDNSAKGEIKTMSDAMTWRENRGLERGRAEGEEKGENSILTLIKKLIDAGKMDEVKRVSEDRTYCRKLLREYGIA